MDNGEQEIQENPEYNDPGSVLYPPKYSKPEPTVNIWLRSALSLAAYLFVGYYIFPDYRILLLITVIIILHECGHFLAMKIFRYNDLGIFFIPLLGAYASGSKREVSQKESAMIILAGPMPGILIGIIFYLLFTADNGLDLFGLSYHTIGVAFILLNLVNLLPVYPLDGGQLLNRVFLDEESLISKIFVWLSIIFLVWFALFGTHKPFYPLLLFPLMMVLRMTGDAKAKTMEKRIMETGIDMDKSYEEMTDEEYWQTRNIVIEEYPAFRDVPLAPPFEFSEKENKILVVIQSLLHRHLIQDLSFAGKILIIILWLGAFAAPWFMGIYQALLHQFGIR